MDAANSPCLRLPVSRPESTHRPLTTDCIADQEEQGSTQERTEMNGTISFNQAPLKTYSRARPLVHPKDSCPAEPILPWSTIIPPTTSTRDLPPLTNLSATVEVTVLSMFPACVLDLLADDKLIAHELDRVDAVSRQILNALIIDGQRTAILACNYLMFANVNAHHPLEMLNWIFFAGTTTTLVDERVRILEEAQSVTIARTPVDVSSLIATEYWANGISIAIHAITSTALPTREACQFIDYAIQLFLRRSSLSMTRRCATSTASLSKVVQAELAKYTEEELLRMGAAVVLNQFVGRSGASFASYSDVSRTSFAKSVREYVALCARQRRKRNSTSKTPRSATTAYPREIPAGLSLLDCPLDPKLFGAQFHFYAVHLFQAYFSIPPKIARWYIASPSAEVRLEELPPSRRADVKQAIASVVENVPDNLEACFRWAARQFKLLFCENVQLAIEGNGNSANSAVLVPLKLDLDDHWTQNFIFSAAILFAYLYSITDPANGELPDAQLLIRAYNSGIGIDHLQHRRKVGHLRIVKRFDQLLADTTSTKRLAPPEVLKWLSKRLQPIDLVSDCPVVELFALSTIHLRARTLGLAYKESSAIVLSLWRHQIGTIIANLPYFECAHCFPYYI